MLKTAFIFLLLCLRADSWFEDYYSYLKDVWKDMNFSKNNSIMLCGAGIAETATVMTNLYYDFNASPDGEQGNWMDFLAKLQQVLRSSDRVMKHCGISSLQKGFRTMIKPLTLINILFQIVSEKDQIIKQFEDLKDCSGDHYDCYEQIVSIFMIPMDDTLLEMLYSFLDSFIKQDSNEFFAGIDRRCAQKMIRMITSLLRIIDKLVDLKKKFKISKVTRIIQEIKNFETFNGECNPEVVFSEVKSFFAFESWIQYLQSLLGSMPDFSSIDEWIGMIKSSESKNYFDDATQAAKDCYNDLSKCGSNIKSGILERFGWAMQA